MSEMIERVALAISGSDNATNILEIHRQRAKAAIAAMREPTPLMMKATNAGEERSKRYWQDMIDAALIEAGEVDEDY